MIKVKQVCEKLRYIFQVGFSFIIFYFCRYIVLTLWDANITRLFIFLWGNKLSWFLLNWGILVAKEMGSVVLLSNRVHGKNSR